VSRWWSAPLVSYPAHMKVLTEARLVEAKQIKTWVFFRPHREAIAEALKDLQDRLSGSRAMQQRK
jgi:DNA-binding transcriptional ArsR family regulator